MGLWAAKSNAKSLHFLSCPWMSFIAKLSTFGVQKSEGRVEVEMRGCDYFVCVCVLMLGIAPRASHFLSKYTTPELQPQSNDFF
jgi:hypothetical protein